MKTTRLTKLLVPGLLLTGTVHLRAETVFEASFDNTPPYDVGGSLPGGFGKVPYGKWYSDQQEGFPILINEEKSLSEPCSLMLENTGVSLEPGQHARVWGTLGTDNVSASPFTKPLSLTCAFLLSRVDGNEAEFVAVSVNGPSGSPVFAVQIGGGGSVVARSHQTTDPVGQIDADRWYHLEILMPDAEQSSARAIVNIYEAKGKERGERIGSAEGPELSPGISYTAFVLSNGMPGSRVFFDDFLVTVQD